MSEDNSAQGRTSFDIIVGDLSIPFFNRNVSHYPTEVGSAVFAPVPVREQKDLMINTAKMNAEQEYNRIMESVRVLQQQALDVQKRLMITELVYRAKYNFKPVHGKNYWLAQDQNEIVLLTLGPEDWSTGAPDRYKYITQVQYQGDHTWRDIKEEK